MTASKEAAAGAAPLVIAVAPNGARRTRDDHPAIPISPAELAATAVAAVAAGASMIHLHVRDDDRAHSLDVGRYREATAAIRAAVGDGIVIQATTEAVGRFSVDEQMACVRGLKPEAFSIAVRELFRDPAGADEAQGRAFLDFCAEAGAAPQFILYDAADVARYFDLAARGAIPPAFRSILFVLGRYSTTLESDPNELRPFLAALDAAPAEARDGVAWMVCAFGRGQRAAATAAVAMGGHARVGMENCMVRPDGTPLADDAEEIAALAGVAAAIARPPADAATARRLLGVG